MKLTAGTTEAITDNQTSNPLYKMPVFQILKFDKQETSTPSRVKANLSDGQYYIKAVFSSIYNHHFEKGIINVCSLIKISNFSCKIKNDAPFIYVQRIEEFEDCSIKHGNPISVTLKSSITNDSFTSESNSKVMEELDVKKNIKEEPKRNEEPIKKRKEEELNVKKNIKEEPKRNEEIKRKEEEIKRNEEEIKRKEEELKKDPDLKKIVVLNPFLTKWTIIGTVLAKSPIRTFSTQKGEGKLFSFEFQDNTCQIKIAAFNEAVDIFYPLIDIGNTYKISKGLIKMTNKQYSSNNCDYEVHLEKSSEIIKLEEQSKIQLNYNFVRIKDFKPKNIVDFIGIIKEVYPVSTITVKLSKKEISKRDILVVDETGVIKTTLWEKVAEDNYEINSVITLKSFIVKEYNGLSLSSTNSSQIFFDSDLERAFEIKGWYEENKDNLQMNLPRRKDKINCIQEVKDNELEYSVILGLIIYIKEDNLWYDACLTEGCHKKVTLEDNGKYRCEKCNILNEECDQRYIVSINLSDFTGQIWCNIFNEPGNILFDISAKELKVLKEENSSEVRSIVKNVYYKEMKFKLKSKHEFYNNEPKTKYTVLSTEKIKYLEESKRLIDEIERRLVA